MESASDDEFPARDFLPFVGKYSGLHDEVLKQKLATILYKFVGNIANLHLLCGYSEKDWNYFRDKLWEGGVPIFV